MPGGDGDATRGVRLAPGMGAAEIHAHTLASDGMVSAEQLVRAAAHAGIAVLAVTDHDTCSAFERAREEGERVGVDVIRGEEVTTALPAGIHVVGLFLEHQIRMGMSLEDTVDAIHGQGGLAVLPHPFMPTFFASISERRARRLLETRRVDGIELLHTAVMSPRGRTRLTEFYVEHRERLGAALGAGDSHFGEHDIGRVTTVFEGRTAADLRRAIEAGATSPARGHTPRGPSLSLRLAQQRRSLLWLPRERRAGRVGRGDTPSA